MAAGYSIDALTCWSGQESNVEEKLQVQDYCMVKVGSETNLPVSGQEAGVVQKIQIQGYCMVKVGSESLANTCQVQIGNVCPVST